MQTYLPFANFAESAACLDRQRLGQQRVETLQIARCLAGVPSSWKKHPSVSMWRGYEATLLEYQDAVVAEWTLVRGYADGSAGETPCLEQTQELLGGFENDEPPFWLGAPELHESHQSALVRKLPDHYRTFFPDVPDDLPLVWPASPAQLVP
jgi:hypothetical protein